MNGNTFLIYTLEEGGLWQAPRVCTEDEYETIKREGEFIMDDFVGPPIHVKPFFIMLVRVERNHDFGAGMSREMMAAAWQPRLNTEGHIGDPKYLNIDDAPSSREP